tara:strand:+ start:130 stop:498 length:369 start_codon:yes stop_codon:yes gene_type:complete
MKLSELHREELEPINREIASIQRQVRNLPKYTHSSVTKELNSRIELLKARKAEIKAKKVETEANYSITFTITGNSEEENVQKINALEEILRVASSKFDNSIDITTFDERSDIQIAIRSELTD